MSIIGLGVAGVLLLIGAFFGAPLTVGLFASLPFGTTAFATLGGSSPLIYTLFAIMMVAAVALKKSFLRELGMVLARHRTAWLMIALAAYSVAGAYLLPRLFWGKMTAFVPIEGAIRPMPLGPTNGNITQTGYFLLGILTFFAISMMLLRSEKLDKMRLGLFAFAITNASLGILDLAGKFVGLGDIFAPIRTASYALLTETVEAGFFRIVGGFSEASAFAATSIACLAFSYTYWRRTGSTIAQGLTGAFGVLLLISTSSTAYGGLGVLGLTAAISLGIGALRGRLKRQDWLLLAGLLAALAILMAAILHNEALLRPFTEMFRKMVLEKGSSSSAAERGMWNAMGMQAFFDSYGLGIGFGSSRTSSWLISALSQLGVIGMTMVAVSIAVMARGMGGVAVGPEDRAVVALCASARACGLASLVAGTISGGGADPGILYFLCLAIVVSCRTSVRDKYLRLQYQQQHSRRIVPGVGRWV